MGFFEDVFSPQSKKPMVGIDLGSHTMKCAEVEIGVETGTKVIGLGSGKTPEGCITGSTISRADSLSEAMIKMLENSQIDTKRVAFSLPSSAVFTKRISLPVTAVQALASNIYFEASNYIPHRMDAIQLDFQVLRTNGSNVEVLLVAIKNEIINSYRSLFELAGLEPIIGDIECLAASNVYEYAARNDTEENLAIIDIGSRVSSISLLNKGIFLISGDASVGGKSYNDALVESLQISPEKAENAKLGQEGTGVDPSLVSEVTDRTTEYVCSELQRQISFLSNGVNLEGGVAKILITGGSAHVPRLLEELAQKTSIKCEYFNPISVFELAENIDIRYTTDLASSMSVALGLSLRRSNDKPEFQV